MTVWREASKDNAETNAKKSVHIALQFENLQGSSKFTDFLTNNGIKFERMASLDNAFIVVTVLQEHNEKFLKIVEQDYAQSVAERLVVTLEEDASNVGEKELENIIELIELATVKFQLLTDSLAFSLMQRIKVSGSKDLKVLKQDIFEAIVDWSKQRLKKVDEALAKFEKRTAECKQLASHESVRAAAEAISHKVNGIKTEAREKHSSINHQLRIFEKKQLESLEAENLFSLQYHLNQAKIIIERLDVAAGEIEANIQEIKNKNKENLLKRVKSAGVSGLLGEKAVKHFIGKINTGTSRTLLELEKSIPAAIVTHCKNRLENIDKQLALVSKRNKALEYSKQLFDIAHNMTEKKKGANPKNKFPDLKQEYDLEYSTIQKNLLALQQKTHAITTGFELSAKNKDVIKNIENDTKILVGKIETLNEKYQLGWEVIQTRSPAAIKEYVDSTAAGENKINLFIEELQKSVEDKKLAAKGIGFFSKKTPLHIQQLKELFKGSFEIKKEIQAINAIKILIDAKDNYSIFRRKDVDALYEKWLTTGLNRLGLTEESFRWEHIYSQQFSPKIDKNILS